ncbi:translation initiation factor IF-2-like isoform X2 [Mustela erminea]|nr:translation initiation factor IF-2-like isoform X2 [Mustela erminea]
MPSLKAERRIRPGSREGLAAALGWLPAGGAPPRRPGLGSSRCWALQVRRPRPPLPGSERTPTPRRRRRVPAARPGLSPTPPRLLPPGTAPPGNGWSCTALPVPAVSQLLHARTWHTVLVPAERHCKRAPPERRVGGEFRPSQGVPGTGPAPSPARPFGRSQNLEPRRRSRAPLRRTGSSLGMLGAGRGPSAGEEESPSVAGDAPAEPGGVPRDAQPPLCSRRFLGGGGGGGGSEGPFLKA